MKYFVRFVGYIIQQPGVELPPVVYYDCAPICEKEDMEPTEDGKVGLKQFIDFMMTHLMTNGMVVPKQNGTQDGTKLRFDQKMGIPRHMLAKIEVGMVRPFQAEPQSALPELVMFETGDEPEKEKVH